MSPLLINFALKLQIMRIAFFLLSLISFAVAGFTQTGPGGVGSSTTNVLWYQAGNSLDAGGSIASNGEAVRTIVDGSGNGNNIIQTTVNQRATLTTNHLNGFAALNFDGVNDNYSDNIGGANYSELDIITVMNFDLASQPASNTDYVYRIGAVYNKSISFSRANINSGANADKYYSYCEGKARFGPVLDNSPTIYAQTFSGTTPFHFLRMDGAVQSVTAHNSNFNLPPEWNIGRFLGTNPHGLDGKIVELIAFNSNLNTTQRIIIENHLASKYALTLTSNDKFAHDVAHGNDVTGIGQESATDNHTDARGASIVRISAANDLEDAEYMLWGHDAGGLAAETGSGNVPNSWLAAGGQKLVQEWRADISGGDNTVGAATIAFDLTGNMFGVDPADFSVLIDTDGDWSDASIDIASPTVVGGVVTFTNVTLADGDFFTIGNSHDIDDCFTLSGGDWDAATTIWDCGSNPGPDSTNNITISDGHSITVLGGDVASANDLTLEADGGSGGGSLILDDGATLIVKGNLVLENGTGIMFNDDAVLILRGVNGNQAFTNNSGSTLTMTNLQLNNTDGATMSGSDQFELSNGLSLTNGNLTNNSTFTFLSDATSTATLSKISNGALIDGAGTNIVQRFRGARDANWGDIGSSGVDTDLEDLNGEVFMSGIVGGNGNAWNNAGGQGTFVSVYTWNATTDVYVPAANTSEAMTPGVGFEIWLADNLTVWGAQTWELQGDINTSTTALTVNSSTGNDWSLVANPFNGFLDWDAITTASGNIDNDDYWYLDADLNTYTSVSAGGGATVPPGQGFWIQTTGITSLSLNPTTALAAGVNTSTFLKRKSQAEETMIHVRNNNEPFGSAVYLRKDEMAFDGFDNRDISPLRVPDARSCRLSIETGAEQLMVNYVPAESEVMEIPMTFEPGLDGDYTFSFDGLDYFSEYSCVSIRNEESGEVQQSLDNSSIITIDNVRSDDAIEYTLIFSKGEYEDCQIASNTEQTEGNINVWNTSDRIIIDYLLDQTVMSNVFVQNSLGQTVWSGSSVASYNRQEISTEALPTGLYVVSVHINGNVQSKKLIIQ
jgi:hypothetical protein